MAFTRPPTRASMYLVDAATWNTDLIDNLDYVYDGTQGIAYTPIWTATGTAPSIGNGSIQGKYWRIGRFLAYRITFTAGSSTTFGTGFWTFTLPVAAADTLGNGTVIMKDNSAGLIKLGASFLTDTTHVAVTFDGDTFIGIKNDTPFTWAFNDTMQISGFIWPATN